MSIWFLRPKSYKSLYWLFHNLIWIKWARTSLEKLDELAFTHVCPYQEMKKNSAKKVQVPNPNSKIWLQSVPVEHKLVSNRQWFIMLVKFLNFRYASSWILCLYGSRGQISDCNNCIGCKRSCTFTCYIFTE